MSDLTREEVKAACGAVGWAWESGEFVLESARDGHGIHRFYETESENTSRSNALALLEATGEDYDIERREDGWWVNLPTFDCVCYEPDLPTAAVRAVNAWAEAKKEERTT